MELHVGVDAFGRVFDDRIDEQVRVEHELVGGRAPSPRFAGVDHRHRHRGAQRALIVARDAVDGPVPHPWRLADHHVGVVDRILRDEGGLRVHRIPAVPLEAVIVEALPLDVELELDRVVADLRTATWIAQDARAAAAPAEVLQLLHGAARGYLKPEGRTPVLRRGMLRMRPRLQVQPWPLSLGSRRQRQQAEHHGCRERERYRQARVRDPEVARTSGDAAQRRNNGVCDPREEGPVVRRSAALPPFPRHWVSSPASAESVRCSCSHAVPCALHSFSPTAL